MRMTRVITTLAMSAVLLVGATGCSMLGDGGMKRQGAHQSNLALQREAALAFRDEWQSDVERIQFKREGARPGIGASWRVNAVATVGATEYQVIIGPTIPPAFVGGGVPPQPLGSASPTPLTVTYSDGTSEVIE